MKRAPLPPSDDIDAIYCLLAASITDIASFALAAMQHDGFDDTRQELARLRTIVRLIASTAGALHSQTYPLVK